MQHSNLAQGKWFSFTLAEQLGNVGSEYERVIKAKIAGDEDHADSAQNRFLELIDLSLADQRWSGAPRRELARLREQSLVEFEYLSNSSEGLSRYYLHFAILARAGR